MTAECMEPAEAMGNVGEGCRRRGLARPQFYKSKRRCQICTKLVI